MSAVTPPVRGFTQTEFEARTARVQRKMRELKIDGMLLTTEPQVRYFTGFLTQFWHSPYIASASGPDGYGDIIMGRAIAYSSTATS